MKFGQRVRQLRKAKQYSQRDLAALVGVGFSYLSRIETGKMNYGDYPSNDLIHRLAQALDANEDELLVLAERVPEKIRKRVLERPEAFSRIAKLDDESLDRLLSQLSQVEVRTSVRHR